MSPLRIEERNRKRSLITKKLSFKKESLVALKLPNVTTVTKYSFNLMRTLKVMGAFCVIVFILEIWMVNRLSNDGQKIAEIKVTQAKLELDNQVLENTIAENSSINVLEQKVSPLGFNTTKNFLYLKPQALIAAN